MKIKNFLAMMLMAACLVACSSDDDGPSPAQSVASTYKGYTNMDSGFFKGNITQNETITLTANEDGTVNVTYNGSTISNVEVKASQDSYKLSGEGILTLAMSGREPSPQECTLTGTINADKSEVEIIFTLPILMQGSVITFRLGDAPENLLVADNYSSYSIGVHNYGTSVYNDETITLTANTEDGTVNFSYSGQWGEATANGLEISKKDDSYTVKGSGVTVISGHGSTGATTNYDFTVEGMISEDKSTASFVIKITDMGAMGKPVVITTHLGDAPAALMIAKDYNGTLGLAVTGMGDQGSIDAIKVTIKAQEDGKVEVTLPAFNTESGMGFTEEIVIKDIELTVEDGTYTLKGDVKTDSKTASGPVEVTGSLDGTIKDGKADIVFKLRPGRMPMDIVATFASK